MKKETTKPKKVKRGRKIVYRKCPKDINEVYVAWVSLEEYNGKKVTEMWKTTFANPDANVWSGRSGNENLFSIPTLPQRLKRKYVEMFRKIDAWSNPDSKYKKSGKKRKAKKKKTKRKVKK
jgi:hypothetical protein